MVSLAIGRTALTERLFAASPAGWDLPAIAPIPKAFAAMVRHAAYDVSEMAIATFLMARAHRKPLLLLPFVLAERAQEAALIGRVASPADLRGRRIGVRAYSQTTGMWLRGVLQHEYGLPPDAMRWVTFEDAHVAEFGDPPWVERAPAGATLEGMLRAGDLDAAIFGMETPDDPALRPVFPPDAGAAFRQKHGFIPVNHLMVARAGTPDATLRGLVEALRAAGIAPRSRAALDPALTLAARFCAEQGLTDQVLTPADIWAGTPAWLE